MKKMKVTHVLLFSSIFFLFLSLQGCFSESSDEGTPDLVSFGNDIVVEDFNTSPAKDPNTSDQWLAKKVLPAKKLNKTYKYKIRVTGSFSTADYLEKHPNDAVVRNTNATASSLIIITIIYTDDRNNTNDCRW